MALVRETFNRIKAIKAVNGQVVIEVYNKEGDEPGAKKLTTQILNIRDAASRALALNKILHKLPKKDTEIAYEIIAQTIATCYEAKKQCDSKNLDYNAPYEDKRPIVDESKKIYSGPKLDTDTDTNKKENETPKSENENSPSEN